MCSQTLEGPGQGHLRNLGCETLLYRFHTLGFCLRSYLRKAFSCFEHVKISELDYFPGPLGTSLSKSEAHGSSGSLLSFGVLTQTSRKTQHPNTLRFHMEPEYVQACGGRQYGDVTGWWGCTPRHRAQQVSLPILQ